MASPEHHELTSWKEIASYLGVTVRTAQKWKQERALPVRNMPGARRGRVLALTEEVDAWKGVRSAVPARRWWQWRLALPLIVLVLLGAWAALALGHRQTAAQFRLAPN